MLAEPAIETLIPADTICRRVQELGAAISADYAGRHLTLLGVLRGSAIFLADLARAITVPVELDFIGLASYGKGTETTGTVTVTNPVRSDLRGRDILIVEDIVDTGITLEALIAYLADFEPRSVAICAFLSKPSRRRVPIQVDYIGFEVPDRFVVGYGLDYAERYRNLPFVGCLDAAPKTTAGK